VLLEKPTIFFYDFFAIFFSTIQKIAVCFLPLAFAVNVLAAPNKIEAAKSKENSIMIELTGLTSGRKLILPTPKHDKNALPKLDSNRPVNRILSSKNSFKNLVVLVFAKHSKSLRPFGGELEIRVTSLKGIKTVDDAVTHFMLANGVHEELQKSSNGTYTGVSIEEVPIGSVITIDLGELGWAPGNTYVYILVKEKGKVVTTLNFSPTYFLKFPWEKAKWLPWKDPEL
jgi:hypothetical protein